MKKGQKQVFCSEGKVAGMGCKSLACALGFLLIDSALQLTFGGMWRCLRVAVARVFALVVRCRIMRLLLHYRVGKNRDTSESPRREPGRAAPLTT